MITKETRRGLAEWRSGYNAARADALDCGIEYARQRHAFGLQGKTYTFCKGYRYYLYTKNGRV